MRCPKEGTRVKFDPTHASNALYSRDRCMPKHNEAGSVKSVSLGRGRATCLGGPGGGLVYVQWDSGCFTGVSKLDLKKASGGALAGAKKRRKKR